jgi:Tfp pilus assembly protein PilN
MADFDLNLSTQPFPAYRLATIALICLLIVLAVVSVWQVQGYKRYSDLARSIRSEEQENRVEAEALAKRVGELESRLDRPESTAKLNEINFLNRLIVQKDLSWTKLFGILENMVPENVHLTTLSPELAEDGSIILRLGVRARTIADVKVFLERMETSSAFSNVDLKLEEKKTDTTTTAATARTTDVDLTMSAVWVTKS